MRCQISWDQNTAPIALVLDKLTESMLVERRAVTSCRPPRSARQVLMWSKCLEFAVQLCTRGTDTMRRAHAANAEGGGKALMDSAQLSLCRAFKLLMLLPALVFGKQEKGKGIGMSARLEAICERRFAPLYSCCSKLTK